MRDVNMNSVRAIERAVGILNVFTAQNPALSIDEIVTATKLPKTTAYRIMYTLELCGLIQYDTKALKYKLGLKLLEYAGVLTTFLDVRQEAEDLLIELHTRTKQTVIMAVPEKETYVYVYKHESPEGLKYSSFIGQRRLLHYGALGHVMMAYLTVNQLDQLLKNHPIPQLTPNTITDPVLVKERLEKIRNEQVFADYEETQVGGSGIGSPIFDAEGNLIAALGIICPSAQLVGDELELAKVLVVNAANQVSMRMGYKER